MSTTTAIPGAGAASPAARVSVLLTVYQRTEYLPVALDSALAQSLREIEVLVLDDSASPRVREIVSRAASDRVRYLAGVERVGVALSVRRGLEAARAPYAAVLNDDDAWEPDFLATLVRPLEEDSGRVLAFCDHWIMDEWGRVDTAASDANSSSYGRATLSAGDVADPARFAVVTNGVPMAMGCVFRRAAIDPSRLTPEVGGAYDYWMTCLLVAGGGRIHYDPRRLTRYRLHRKMESRQRDPNRRDLVFIMGELRRQGLFPDLGAELARAHAAALLQQGKRLLTAGRSVAACSAFARSLWARPSAGAAVAAGLCALPAGLRLRLLARRERQ